ncbi:MAG TPA: site-specific integrase [Pseudolabrys sp.]
MSHNRYLTDRTLKSLAPAHRGRRYELWDTIIPGFGVRVNDEKDRARGGKAGRITFVLYTRFPKSPHPTRRALGRYGQLTLEAAREKAARWRAMIDKGIDPAAAEEEERQARLRQMDNTFASVAEKFIEYIKANKERKAKDVERELQPFIRSWGHRPIASIKPSDIALIIEATVKRGKRAQAHNLFGHIRRLFRWAIPLYVEHSPCAQLSQKRLIGERQRRDRILSDAEIAALWKATEPMGYPYGPLYRLLLLTGLRLSEVSEASWQEFDFNERVWTIPAARMKKTGSEAKPHIVPLTDAMLEVIETLPRFESGKFLFSSQSGLRPIKAVYFSGPKIKLDELMRQLLEVAQPPDWTNHDIRRTVRTKLSALRIPEEVREAVLAHARPGIKGHYDMHHYLDEKRDALTQWAAKLRDIVEPSKSVVVDLRSRR